ncbi:hypothetical protein F4X90_04185 [Candidatus Poribacteria bacterium]|nr:hypothetical protein [Candidatus Poribacteria bacterium]
MMNAQILRDLSEKLDTAVSLLEEIYRAISAPVPSETSSQEPGFVEVSGMEAPWVVDGLVWDGKSEVADETELTGFLGFNPNGKTGGKSWCAGFWIPILRALGFDVSNLDLRAVSYENFGYALDIDCNLAVDALMELIPDGAILVFQPDPDGEFPISHIGVKVDGNKLFGGNQGDKAKRSNLLWYLQHAKLTAIRCPDGYKLV